MELSFRGDHLSGGRTLASSYKIELSNLVPHDNGSSSRLDRIERQLEKLGEISSGLITHAELTDQRIEHLREAQRETNVSVQSLVGAIRDLIHRIPAENSR